MLKKLAHKFIPALDVLLYPVTYAAALWFLFIRKYGVQKMPASRSAFWKIGVFPIRDHYYEPLFNPKHLNLKTRDKRNLPGINLNEDTQLRLLSEFSYQDELAAIPAERESGKLHYYYNNPSFFAGDAEVLYNMIRFFKPKRIIEIGSGNSTLMMLQAVNRNKQIDNSYDCTIKCIEPYEVPWLEESGVEVIRKMVQDIDLSFFQELEENDILFIDSSHIIRPQGDVLYEYLELLPTIKKGVIIHIHDIFTPRDYLNENFDNYVVFLNEQYMLEALLSANDSFEIISAVNYLKHDHFDALAKACPVLAKNPDKEPRSIWIRKNK
ncbi:class I SAM-dependent methyltransferase [Pontibacter ramchanderi]|uniref:Methyltransferase family protein n=1 Tax=Pontibacter ramchanderi TaxID=1179743 RepID=A0A2N3U7M1_9BACT|nr:class I SAM-dependent methyltransferase [Pontibacter ramchanderi]PKV62743.1 methyltransferase family protein [Pontibacter ramchanderi]